MKTSVPGPKVPKEREPSEEELKELEDFNLDRDVEDEDENLFDEEED